MPSLLLVHPHTKLHEPLPQTPNAGIKTLNSKMHATAKHWWQRRFWHEVQKQQQHPPRVGDQALKSPETVQRVAAQQTRQRFTDAKRREGGKGGDRRGGVACEQK